MNGDNDAKVCMLFVHIFPCEFFRKNESKCCGNCPHVVMHADNIAEWPWAIISCNYDDNHSTQNFGLLKEKFPIIKYLLLAKKAH